MKTLIIYATKHGSTQKCAEILAHKFTPPATAINVKNMSTKLLSDYDNIIIGTSVYGGKIRKDMSRFLFLNQANLQTRSLSIFLVSGFEDEKTFEHNFPKSLLNHSIVNAHFGYEFHFATMNKFEKFMTKRLTSEHALKTASIHYDRIDAFYLALSDYHQKKTCP